MAEERVELDPLDVPLSRRDVLDLLCEFRTYYVDRDTLAPRPATIGEIERHFRAEWSKRPPPEKATRDVTDEPHDA